MQQGRPGKWAAFDERGGMSVRAWGLPVGMELAAAGLLRCREAVWFVIPAQPALE